MKFFLASLLSLILFTTHSKKEIKIENKFYLTCYGKTPCNACKSCNYCKHCTSGGTCGICAQVKKKVETQKTENPSTDPQKQKTSTKAPGNVGQCKATTKKGTRCSRAARSNGYCWQHGG